MRRTPLFRLLSAVLALWFALGLVESSALHVCPMHDGGAGAAVPAAAAHGAGHGVSHGVVDAPGPSAIPADGATGALRAVGASRVIVREGRIAGGS